MSTQTHTPGPWYVVRAGDFYSVRNRATHVIAEQFSHIDDALRATAALNTVNGLVPNHVGFCGCTTHADLLAALREIADLTCTGPDPIGPLFGAGVRAGIKAASDIARAALARAQT